jgi:hypothetical protein
MKSLTSQGVSSDESATDDETSHKAFRRISPVWRSEALQGFMWALDTVIRANRIPKIGHRSIRGAEPRRRLFGSSKNLDAIAPPGLPRNCYHEDWLRTLTPSQLRMLELKDVIYKFGTDGSQEQPSPPPIAAFRRDLSAASGPSWIPRPQLPTPTSSPSGQRTSNIASSSTSPLRKTIESGPMPLTTLTPKCVQGGELSKAAGKSRAIEPALQEREDFTEELERVSDSSDEDQAPMS